MAKKAVDTNYQLVMSAPQSKHQSESWFGIDYKAGTVVQKFVAEAGHYHRRRRVKFTCAMTKQSKHFVEGLPFGKTK